MEYLLLEQTFLKDSAMDLKLTVLSLNLLILLVAYGSEARKMGEGKKEHSHMDHMVDPSSSSFFLIDDIKLGKEFNTLFPRRDLPLATSPKFLPREVADTIPFSLNQLPKLLRTFSFSPDSPQAKAMEHALSICEDPPIKGETRYCATSLEALLEFVAGIMGQNVRFNALSTTHFTNSTPIVQKYTVLDVPKQVASPKVVGCHTVSYAYIVYLCHHSSSEIKVFRVPLRGENGDRVEAISVCHMDTSEWSPDHLSFCELGTLPGQSPVCHFFPSDHLVWVPKFHATSSHAII